MDRTDACRDGHGEFTGFIFILIFACLFSVVGEAACLASTVALQWGATSGATGYKVYYQADSATQPFTGTGSAQGSAPIDVLNQTNATIGGLDPAHSYYFAVTAYNATGESAYSNIVNIPELVSPVASITSPSNNATICGTVSVTTDASDNVGVTKVEFYVNGALKATDKSSPYVYSWNTSSLAAGAYTLMVKAYDAAGNVGPSANVPVNVVKDATAPTVSLTSPPNNSVVSGNITITASASDNIGVSKVEFYEDGTLLTATNVAPYTYTRNTTTTTNGTHLLTARAYDAAGNVSSSSVVTVTVNNQDTTFPTVSVSSPASNATVSGTVSVTATAGDNIGVARVEFYVNGALQSTDTVSPYTFSWNTTSIANGSYALYAKAYDAAGNVSQSPNVSITVSNPDTGSSTTGGSGSTGSSTTGGTTTASASTASKPDTAAPSVSITAPAAGAKVGGTVTVAASASDNVKVARVDFYVNGTLKATDGASPFSYNWNTTTIADGSYTIYARAYDTAGNSRQSSSVTVTVKNADTTAPSVSLTAPAAGAKVGGTVTVAADASDDVKVAKVEFYINGTLKATDSASPFSYSWDTAAVADGNYTVYAKAYDAAGNSRQSSSVTVTVGNAVAAAATTVSVTSPAAGAKVCGTVTVAASAGAIAGAKVEFYINNKMKARVTASPYIYSWNTKKGGNGNYTIYVKAYDAAGKSSQSSSVAVTVDNSAPTVSITSPSSKSTVAGTVTIAAKASDKEGVTRVDFFANDQLLATVTDSPYNYDWNTTTVADGGYTLYAKAYDGAGNVKQSSSKTVTVDNTLPEVSLTSPATDSTVRGTVAVSASAGDNLKVKMVEYYINGVLKATDKSFPYSCKWNTKSWANDSYTIYAKVYDGAGNVSQSSPVSVTVDNSAPKVFITAPVNKATVNGIVAVSADASDNVGVTRMEYYLNGSLKATLPDSPYIFNWDTGGYARGKYKLTVKAYDAANNVGTNTVTLNIK